MSNDLCPFCGLDPYEYADVGIGMVPVAVSCCDLGYRFYQKHESLKKLTKIHKYKLINEKKQKERLLKKEVAIDELSYL